VTQSVEFVTRHVYLVPSCSSAYASAYAYTEFVTQSVEFVTRHVYLVPSCSSAYASAYAYTEFVTQSVVVTQYISELT